MIYLFNVFFQFLYQPLTKSIIQRRVWFLNQTEPTLHALGRHTFHLRLVRRYFRQALELIIRGEQRTAQNKCRS